MRAARFALIAILLACPSTEAARPGFEEALEALLSQRVDRPLGEGSTRHEAWKKLKATATPDEIRDSLLMVLMDPKRQSSWLSATFAWEEYAFNLSGDTNRAFEYLITWARTKVRDISSATRADHLSEARLLDRVCSIFRAQGTQEDTILLHSVADSLPSSQDQIQAKLKLLADQLQVRIREREQARTRAKAAAQK